MSIQCKHCGSVSAVKNGRTDNKKQRYKCKECAKVFRIGDHRQKYSFEQKLRVLKWYLDGAGISSISRNEGVSTPLIIKWLRGFAKILRARLNEVEIPQNARNIEILEIDEMFTYCQKKLTKSTSGLLLIGDEMRLLILK
jgi:transposase-like protein